MLKFQLDELLVLNNMTKIELSKLTGIRQPTIYNICSGKIKEIPVTAIEKICEVLSCQPGDFIKFESELNLVERRRMNMKREFTIKKTTKEERQAYADNAIALSTLDSPEPTSETKDLINEYVKGNMELEDVKNSVIDRYKKAAQN